MLSRIWGIRDRWAMERILRRLEWAETDFRAAIHETLSRLDPEDDLALYLKRILAALEK